MENREYGQVVDNPQAPYVNGLARKYALAADSYSVTHPSLPNYLALLGGSTFGITSDCTDCTVHEPNLPDQLRATGLTWKGYVEDLPRACFLGATAGWAAGVGATYGLKHNPFLYFQDIRDTPDRCDRVVPLTEFESDLTANTLPSFAWITPNVVHDMHNGSTAEGDAWLAAFVPRILASPAWRGHGLLIVTWDEGHSNAGCCGASPGGGHIPTLFVSPDVKPGYRSTAPINHYGVLRTIEDLWSLGHLGHSGEPGVRSALDVFA